MNADIDLLTLIARREALWLAEADGLVERGASERWFVSLPATDQAALADFDRLVDAHRLRMRLSGEAKSPQARAIERWMAPSPELRAWMESWVLSHGLSPETVDQLLEEDRHE